MFFACNRYKKDSTDNVSFCFQHDIVEQQDMVTLFQQRVGKVHKHVAQTKEDISYSAAMKQDLESKIDTYDETIEKKEILSKELSSIQDVYEISQQFNSSDESASDVSEGNTSDAMDLAFEVKTYV